MQYDLYTSPLNISTGQGSLAVPRNPPCLQENIHYKGPRLVSTLPSKSIENGTDINFILQAWNEKYDLRSSWAYTSSECQEKCQSSLRCQFWTFMRLKGTRKAYCYRMKEIKHSFEDEETISGTKTCKHVSYIYNMFSLGEGP